MTVLDLPERWDELRRPDPAAAAHRARPAPRRPGRPRPRCGCARAPAAAPATSSTWPSAEAFARRLAAAAHRRGHRSARTRSRAPPTCTDLLGLGDVRELRPRGAPGGRGPPRDRLRVPIGVGDDRRAGRPRHQGVRPAGHGPARPGHRRDRLRQVGAAAHAGARPGADPLARARSTSCWSTSRAARRSPACPDMPHVSAVITNLADELTLVDRMQDALSGEMVRRQELLREAGNYASVRDYEKARAAGERRSSRCPSLFIVVDEFSELLVGQAGVHRPVRHDRPPRPLARRAPAARLAAAGGGPAARPRVPPVLPDRPAHVLRRGVPRPCSACPTPTSCRPSRASATSSPTSRRCCGSRRAYVSGPAQAARRGRHAGVEAARARHPAVHVGRRARRPRAGAPSASETPDAATARAERATRCSTSPSTGMAGHGPAAHQVWLPPLDVPDTLDELMPDLVEDPELGLARRWRRRGGAAVPLGIVDRPREQRRDTLRVDLSGAGRPRRASSAVPAAARARCCARSSPASR